MWMILCVVLWSSVASHAWAQKATSIEYQDVTIHNARTVVHDGTFVNVNQSNSIGFDVQISGTATVTFRVSGAGRFGWNDLTCYPSDSTTGVTSATATGFYQCNVAGADVASARLDVCTGCTVTVVARTGTAIYGKSSGGGSGGSGDVTDVWACTSGNCNALTGAAGDSLDAGSADSSKPATRSTSLPGTCTEGQMHHDTDSGGTETYICTAANTWTKLAVDGSAGSSVGPASVTVNAGNSPYTVLSTDYLILCDTTLAARVVNLHAATTNHIIAVSNLGSNTCTINRNGTDTIVGDTVVILSAQHDGITMIADGSSRWTLH